MSRECRYALLNQLRKQLRQQSKTDREIADLIVHSAKSQGLIDETKYLTGQQLDLLCRPTSGKTVNRWVFLGAFQVYSECGFSPVSAAEVMAVADANDLKGGQLG